MQSNGKLSRTRFIMVSILSSLQARFLVLLILMMTCPVTAWLMFSSWLQESCCVVALGLQVVLNIRSGRPAAAHSTTGQPVGQSVCIHKFDDKYLQTFTNLTKSDCSQMETDCLPPGNLCNHVVIESGRQEVEAVAAFTNQFSWPAAATWTRSQTAKNFSAITNFFSHSQAGSCSFFFVSESCCEGRLSAVFNPHVFAILSG